MKSARRALAKEGSHRPATSEFGPRAVPSSPNGRPKQGCPGICPWLDRQESIGRQAGGNIGALSPPVTAAAAERGRKRRSLEPMRSLLRRHLGWFRREASLAPDAEAVESETRYAFPRSQDRWSPDSRRGDAAPKRVDRAGANLEKQISALTVSEGRFQRLALLGSDWHWNQDARLRFTSVNGNLADPIGTTIKEHLGVAPWDLPNVEPAEGGWDVLRRCQKGHETFRNVVLRRPRQDGGISYVSISGEPLFAKDGAFIGYHGIGLDITKQKIIEADISKLARLDPLTGLCNRTSFFERLNHALAVARRHDRSIALLFLDLDRFKDVNDAFGHIAGDEVLKVIARRLNKTIREHRRGCPTGRRRVHRTCGGNNESGRCQRVRSTPAGSAFRAVRTARAGVPAWRKHRGRDVSRRRRGRGRTAQERR